MAVFRKRTIRLRRRRFAFTAATVSTIQFDAKSTAAISFTSSYSWNHTCTGSNRFLVVSIGVFGPQTVSSVTYNSVALTLIKAQTNGTIRVESWGLIAPASGTNSIAVTLSGSIQTCGAAVSYTGVNQSTATEASNSNTGTGPTNATVAVTTVTANDWIYAACVTTMSGGSSPTASQIARNSVTGTGSLSDEDTGPIASPGSNTMTFTGITSLSDWTMVGFGIIPGTGTVYTAQASLMIYSSMLEYGRVIDRGNIILSDNSVISEVGRLVVRGNELINDNSNIGISGRVIDRGNVSLSDNSVFTESGRLVARGNLPILNTSVILENGRLIASGNGSIADNSRIGIGTRIISEANQSIVSKSVLGLLGRIIADGNINVYDHSYFAEQGRAVCRGLTLICDQSVFGINSRVVLLGNIGVYDHSVFLETATIIGGGSVLFGKADLLTNSYFSLIARLIAENNIIIADKSNILDSARLVADTSIQVFDKSNINIGAKIIADLILPIYGKCSQSSSGRNLLRSSFQLINSLIPVFNGKLILDANTNIVDKSVIPTIHSMRTAFSSFVVSSNSKINLSGRGVASLPIIICDKSRFGFGAHILSSANWCGDSHSSVYITYEDVARIFGIEFAIYLRQQQEHELYLRQLSEFVLNLRGQDG